MHVMTIQKKNRCGWVGEDPLEVAYHDAEWGVPVHDDRVLFEFLILEGAQAGLSWWTILRKRDRYGAVFARFDPSAVARFGEDEIDTLVLDAGIVRHRGKIESTVRNARAFLEVQEAFGSFDDYLWRFVDGSPIQNRWERTLEIPARTPVSERLSRDLKQRGFTFVGPTICYAFMQAVGMVNDHTAGCFRHEDLRRLAA
jgi:DNA-3-methyladenine glycosylase I